MPATGPARGEPAVGRADLHTHTTASDGLLRPDQLVTLAAQRGLAAIAITDHDTTDGAVAAASFPGLALRLVIGVELSCAIDGVDVHVLAYGVDPADASLRSLVAERASQRLDRAAAIVDRLVALGAPISLDRVRELAGDGVIGRPHLARALVEAGHVDTVGDAFARYLATGRPAYVERPELRPEDAIPVIHGAGGAAVLAHPLYSEGYREFLPALVDAGLDGIEVVYPDHNDATRDRLGALAREYDLIATGGTDFHADQGRPGRGLGETSIDVSVIDALAERAARRGAGR